MARERKLAAIMFTDIVGYTSLMGESEKKTFEIINTNRLIHQKHVEAHHGRIIKELGDGLLTVFENGTEAVLCAVEIQKEAKKNDIPLRIGIHEGEVVVENKDVFGDGVNIASRIQAEAAPGGICLSDSVYRIIRNKEGLQVGKIGRVSLKNVREPLILYQVISHDLSVRPKKKIFKQSWGFFLLIGIVGILIGIFLTQRYLKHNNPLQIKHLSINFPDHAPLDKTMYRSINNSFAISPDGKLLVYMGKTNNSTNLYKRPLNANTCEIIPGTENAQNPFFSPDGKWIGYYAENALRKIQLTGGQSTVLCYVKESTKCTWLPNDSIIFGGNQMEGLKIIHSSGGTERVLTQLNLENEELMHSYPFYIPGAHKVLYSIQSVSEFISTNSLDLKTGDIKVLVKNASNPKYTPEGYLTYDFQGSLIANKYDPEKDLLSDDPIIIIDNTKNNTSFYGIQYDFSGDGTLLHMVYQIIINGELVEVDMEGNIKVLITEDNSWIVGPKYSPDGKNIAFWITKEEGSHVWIYNPARDHLTRFTSEGTNAWPIWTPDGWNIAFPSIRGSSGDLNMYIKPFGSTQASEILIKTDKTHTAQGMDFRWSYLVVSPAGRKRKGLGHIYAEYGQHAIRTLPQWGL